MKLEWINPEAAAGKWGVNTRQVQQLCADGKVDGVVRLGRSWLIPKDAPKPLDRRRKENRGRVKVDSAAVDRIIRNVNGTMAIEGMPLTDDDISNLRLVLCGEVSVDEIVRRIAREYTSRY